MKAPVSPLRVAFAAIAAFALFALGAPSVADTTQQPPAFHELPDESPTPEAVETQDPNVVGAPAAIDPADAKNVQLAKEWFTRLQNGDIDRSQLTPAFSDALTDVVVQATSAHLKPLGDPTGFLAAGKIDRDGVTKYLFRIEWPQGGIVYQFAVEDESGKIAGLFTRPAPPPSLTR